MKPFDQRLTEWVMEAWQKVDPALTSQAESAGPVVPAANPQFGDYQYNGVIGVAKRAGRNPRVLAQALLEALPLPDVVEQAEAAGPGFLNFRLRNRALADGVAALAMEPRCGTPLVGDGRTVVMDYSSPNIAKPMHIGHIRSTVIGDALDRIHRFLGYRVISDNHLGDWGTQFGLLILGYRHFVDARALEEDPIEELERIYVKSYERAQSDPEWMEAARRELVKLQQGDPENRALWERFVALSLEEFDRLYRRLGVSFDLVRGESFYRDRLAGVVEELVRRGMARESEGAWVVFLDEEKLPPCLVRKRDGGFNYATTDIATLLSRDEEFHPDKIIYVTDERQQLHFRQIFAIGRRLGIRAELIHVWFGLMRLPEGTFSTRQGNVIKLERLLDEAERRALELVRQASPDMSPERQREVARAVGIGAVRYADLSQNPQTLVTFTWEKTLNLNGNSAPYLQYAYARIMSVLDKYRERFPEGRFEEAPIRLDEPAERDVALRLVRFPEAVLAAARAYRPNLLADALFALAQSFSTLYQTIPFLPAPPEQRDSRVRLAAATARVLREGLRLLGIETPERI
jgi:arginyl-tRNA synthetase